MFVSYHSVVWFTDSRMNDNTERSQVSNGITKFGVLQNSVKFGMLRHSKRTVSFQDKVVCYAIS